MTGALATDSAGVRITISTYSCLSQLTYDVQAVYKSVQDLQDQIVPLAEVVLQNRSSLELLQTREAYA